MPNTARTSGKNDTKTFLKNLQSPDVLEILSGFNALLQITDETSHNRAIAIAGDFMDLIQDDPKHPLNPLLDLLADAIQAYEKTIYAPIRISPAETLRLLMEEHALKQIDLAEDLGGQGNVSKILAGRRKLSARQIEILSKRFHVSPEVFLNL